MMQVKNLDPEFRDCISQKKVEPFYRAVNLDAQRRPSYDKNVLFVGDAASFKDQCSASGIMHALRDAFLASDALGGQSSISFGIYDRLRRLDHDKYFDFVCTQARMDAPTEESMDAFRKMNQSESQKNNFFALLGDANEFAACA